MVYYAINYFVCKNKPKVVVPTIQRLFFSCFCIEKNLGKVKKIFIIFGGLL